MGLPWWVSGKESACQWRRLGIDLWVRKIPLSRKWLPIPVFPPRKSHGQSILEGYSPWGSKESSTTEHSFCMKVKELVVQPCPCLCNPMDWGLPARFLCPGDFPGKNARLRAWNSPGKNTGVGSHSFLQGIFPTQASNPGLPHCKQILYHLTHQDSPQEYLKHSQDCVVPTKICFSHLFQHV